MNKYAAVIQELMAIQDDPAAYMDKVALDLMTPEQITARMQSSVVDPHLVDFGLKSKAVQGVKDVGRSASRYLRYAPAAAGILPLLGAILPGRQAAPPPTTIQRVLMAAGRHPGLAIGGLLAGGAGLGYLASHRDRPQQPAQMGV